MVRDVVDHKSQFDSAPRTHEKNMPNPYFFFSLPFSRYLVGAPLSISTRVIGHFPIFVASSFRYILFMFNLLILLMIFYFGTVIVDGFSRAALTDMLECEFNIM